MIEIIKVESKVQEREFVMFPFSLYKGCDYWVPPIISEELESMDKEKNPVFENAEAEFYIAMVLQSEELQQWSIGSKLKSKRKIN